MRRIVFPMTVLFAGIVFAASCLGSGGEPPMNPASALAVNIAITDQPCPPAAAAQLTAAPQAVPANQGTSTPAPAAPPQQPNQVAPSAGMPTQQPGNQSGTQSTTVAPQPASAVGPAANQAGGAPAAPSAQNPVVQAPAALPSQAQPQQSPDAKPAPAMVCTPESSAQAPQPVGHAQPAAVQKSEATPAQPQAAAAPNATAGKGGGGAIQSLSAAQVTPVENAAAKPASPAHVLSGKQTKDQPKSAPGQAATPGAPAPSPNRGSVPQQPGVSAVNPGKATKPAQQPVASPIPGSAPQPAQKPTVAAQADAQDATRECVSCPGRRPAAPTGDKPVKPVPPPTAASPQTTGPGGQSAAGATAPTKMATEPQVDAKRAAGSQSMNQPSQAPQQCRVESPNLAATQQGQASPNPVTPEPTAQMKPQAGAPQGATQAGGSAPQANVATPPQTNWQNAPATAGSGKVAPAGVVNSR